MTRCDSIHSLVRKNGAVANGRKLTIVLVFCIVNLMLGARTQAEESRAETSHQADRPNLIIIQTDEHNFRTLGCYREQLSFEQAHVWGAETIVETPNIDLLAKEGAICTRYYVASPVCTPSRASMMSGLYPQATGSWKNDLPLNDNVVTFAEVLRRKGYATSYVGKWHLDGKAKPGWAPKRKFGFTDNRFMFNRGHWKMFKKTGEGENLGAEVIGQVNEKTGGFQYQIKGATRESFATDFLTDRALELIARDKSGPFCVMLALPDPHGPNTVRAPYDTMFDDLVFERPPSMVATLENPGVVPKWNQLNGKKKTDQVRQAQMRKYFGMVKCVDDNVGRILDYLKANGLAENTIVVFTSDHGDMLCEHCRLNKGLPYETSAKVPFVLRYPAKIQAGKIIEAAQTNVDFAPTILSLMNVDGELPSFHGEDTSIDFLCSDAKIRNDRIVYFRQADGRWVSAVDDRFKLVLSQQDTPWLFDLERDPDELINYYNDPKYAATGKRLQEDLLLQLKEFADPALENNLKLK